MRSASRNAELHRPHTGAGANGAWCPVRLHDDRTTPRLATPDRGTKTGRRSEGIYAPSQAETHHVYALNPEKTESVRRVYALNPEKTQLCASGVLAQHVRGCQRTRIGESAPTSQE